LKPRTKIALAGLLLAAPAADKWENHRASCHGMDGKEKMKAFKAELTAQEIQDLVGHIRKFKT